MSSCSRLLLILSLVPFASGELVAQEQGTEAPTEEVPGVEKPLVEIHQGSLPNPVSDEVTLMNRTQLSRSSPDFGAMIPAVIRVQHRDAPFGYAWDPVECRLLFAWRGDRPQDLVYVAEGPSPLAGTIGVWGAPEYFGYRLVDGVPEFLYRLGKIAVEEKLLPSADGARLTQHFKVYQADFGAMFSVPSRCRNLIDASQGRWSENFLNLTEEAAGDFSLTWTWKKTPDLPPLAPAWVAMFSEEAEQAPANSPASSDQGTEDSSPSDSE